MLQNEGLEITTKRVTMITYLRVIKNFENAEEDGDSVAETNFPDILNTYL